MSSLAFRVAIRSNASKVPRLSTLSNEASARRCFGHSAPPQKALPFSLNSLGAGTSAEAAQGSAAGEGGRVLRMVMFGKPGAGKGTLSGRLVKKYDILTLSVGDLLRQHIAERTDIGREAEGVMAAGGLVSDDIVLKVVTSKIDALRNKHWILDGFPRTLVQGKMLDRTLKERGMPLSLIINLDVADEIILSRISDRWVHLPSGRVYNISYNRPKVDGFDDVTDEPLTKRPDDNPEIFSRRLKQFYDATAPLLAYYAGQPSTAGKLFSLKGETSDEIWPQLESVVRNSFPSLRERVENAEERRRHSLSEVVTVNEDPNITDKQLLAAAVACSKH